MLRTTFSVIRQKSQMASWLAIWALLQACGTFVGNPTKPGDKDTGDETENVALPDITINLNDSVSDYDESADVEASLNLAGPGRLTQNTDLAGLREFGRSFERTIRRVNALSRFIRNDSGVTELGTRENLGVFGGVSTVLKISEAEGYAYEATICYESSPVAHYQWTPEGNLSVYYSYARSPLRKLADNLMTKLDVMPIGSEEGKTFTLQSSGEVARQDGESLPFRSRMVGDYSPQEFSFGAYNLFANEAGEYGLTKASFGKSDNEGAGVWVGWRRTPLSDVCAQQFDFTSPEFCVGVEFDVQGQTVNREIDRSAAYDSIEFNGKDTFGDTEIDDVVFPETAECP